MVAVLDFLAPEIEWKVRTDLPDARLYRGHEGIRELMSHFDEVMEDMWFQHRELIAVGEEQVLAPLRWGGRGKGSGVDFDEGREAWLFTVLQRGSRESRNSRQNSKPSRRSGGRTPGRARTLPDRYRSSS